VSSESSVAKASLHLTISAARMAAWPAPQGREHSITVPFSTVTSDGVNAKRSAETLMTFGQYEPS